MTFRELEEVSDYVKVITENPENAVILAYLELNEAIRVFQNLPTEALPDVIKRIAGADWESAERILKENFPSVPVEYCEAVDGKERVLLLLELAVSPAWRKAWRQVIGILEHDDPELAEVIKERFFVFDDIVELDDHSIQKVLRETDSVDLAKALRTTDPETEEKIFRNMSQQAVMMVREDVNYKGLIKLKYVNEAQHKICSIVWRLAEAGECAIPRLRD